MSNNKKAWNHGSDMTGRFRGGKTQSDHASGAAKNAANNKQKPIRCTSSYRMGGQDNGTPQFWGG